ncbi:putative spermidine/putrescine transport system permease protein [Roseovarius halotolerans]|uniref:Spermidine/putrescine transport system permease protein PotB n=1 Tax=Roseovarius halotolerans TaxID=505353 RepID=A0A1X6Z5E0_9RHOB|nr:ABC transporter permease [Roseovarius halotolerans]RKT32179.1 putative spermidine/putrescine transport system permease protein [Roseovarius halotolerans]SLN41027.1 Spermidine/putrescine transport system permease protein PotB [Roseovarius halotolerans]
MSDTTDTGPVLAADGTPLKRSLRRAIRAQKLRALALIAPLLIFVLVTFIAPIADMLFRSVENQIVSNTLPNTVATLNDWDGTGETLPGDQTFEALFYDMFLAAESKRHTRLGSRLNYEQAGISSMFRTSGRNVDEVGEDQVEALEDLNDAWSDETFWFTMMSGPDDAPKASDIVADQRERLAKLNQSGFGGEVGFAPSQEIADLLPRTVRAYTAFAVFTAIADEDVVAEEEPWEAVKVALIEDLRAGADLSGYQGAGAEELRAAQAGLADQPEIDYKQAFIDMNEDWANLENWKTIKMYAPPFTAGYFLNAIDLQKTPEGFRPRPENEQIYIMLFQRTLFMSLVIMGSCILLGYPVAYLLATLPSRSANLLMILVLLPFWTSLLVRTSAWKVMLQQQGVINDTLVWLGLVNDAGRLVMINNQFGTIVAMTHILLPFMILPMYSVMSTIPQTYVRAARSLGATNWTSFWRVYFPQSVPGIGAGSILVFILAIGYYITPEIVGGTTGTFISNRIAYHISSSLNWGLAAALGSILLFAVLILYWAYDKIVGIDNVKLG